MRVLTAAPPDRGGGVTLVDEERGKSGEAGSRVVGGASDRPRARTGNPSHNTQPHPSLLQRLHQSAQSPAGPSDRNLI